MLRSLILASIFLFLVLGGAVKAEEIFLKCVTGETSNYTYINTTKKLVGEAYLQKNKKDLYIYDWVHEDVKISDKEIEYKSTNSFWRGYSPKNKNYHKIVIDRYSGSRQSYIKDPYIFTKFIPKFFDNIIDPLSYTWLFQNWEKSVVLFCEKSNLKNLNFIFKSKRDFEIEKEQSQNNSKKF
ncbi:hypothetical protein MCEMKE138_01097 [Candidatus Pelagibacterales bacterium]